MNIVPEEAKKLVGQQQIAHKLLAGFYQNIISMFTNIAESCRMEFKYWNPRLYSKPCRQNTYPLKNWIWDMFPLYASQFGFLLIHNPSSASTGDKAMHIELHCDGGYEGGNMPPLSINSKDGYIDIMLYKCIKATEENSFEDLYREIKCTNEIPCQWKDAGEYFQMYHERYELADFISNFEAIQKKIKECMG